MDYQSEEFNFFKVHFNILKEKPTGIFTHNIGYKVYFSFPFISRLEAGNKIDDRF